MISASNLNLSPDRESLAASSSSPDLQKFLRFQLGGKDTTLIAVEPIVEIIPLNIREILPVPQMPSYVLGIYNWRGDMLWLSDLGHLVGFPPLFQSRASASRAMAIVVGSEEKSMGLVVSEVTDIEAYSRAQMRPSDPQLFSDRLLPFLQGYFITDSNEILVALEVRSLFQVPTWRSLV
ncbi:MAG TPA: purine-binding chemotaxis protein CheW [Oscillatoriales cyanobacterium M59_W2019_021]|nr:MAG: purine-binding chemotaxis protein CheW [Cyanobacteria bacterium J055]HIK33888.1 purine-binding chemotaxis protein CheW [Oscillatoriales cyanobacterium M4454_W2019_049]HIK49918.1 purine-binding chemotaxis protein CheW [Oscillatoriales cyanobacterium M59_W2019_021]